MSIISCQDDLSRQLEADIWLGAAEMAELKCQVHDSSVQMQTTLQEVGLDLHALRQFTEELGTQASEKEDLVTHTLTHSYLFQYGLPFSERVGVSALTL